MSAPPTPPAEENKKGKENFWFLLPRPKGADEARDWSVQCRFKSPRAPRVRLVLVQIVLVKSSDFVQETQPVLKNYSKKYKEYWSRIKKAESDSTNIINPDLEVGIYFWVPDFETSRFIKKNTKQIDTGIFVQNEEKRGKYIEKINKEFRDFLEVETMGTGSPDLGDFFIELGNSPISVFIKDFIVIKIVEDAGDKIWEKIKNSFSSVFKQIKLSKRKTNIKIIIEGSAGVTTFVLSKDLKSKEIDFSLEKIPDILKVEKNKNRNNAYIFNKTSKKWESKKSIVLE